MFCDNQIFGEGNLVRSSPPNFREGDLKISDQNNWWGPEQKISLGGGAKFKGGRKILGGPINPSDGMVVVLKDILLCLLRFRIMCIVYIG